MPLGLGQLFGGLLLGQMAGGGLLGGKQEEEQPTQMANNSIGGAFQGISNSMFKGMSQEDVYRMGLGFNTLRLEPDANLATSVENRISSINATKKAEADAAKLQGQVNQTVDYLTKLGRPDLVQMVQGGIITPAKAFEMSVTDEDKGTKEMQNHAYAMKIIEEKGGIENVTDVERVLLGIPVPDEKVTETERRLQLLANPPEGGWDDNQLRIIGVPQETIPVFKKEQLALQQFAEENPTYYTRDLNGDGMPDNDFAADMRAIIVGGSGGTNVEVNIEQERENAWMSAAVKPQLERIMDIEDGLPKLESQIKKIYAMQDILDSADEGKITTGVLEPIITQMTRFANAIGLENADQAINAELLQAAMGSDVFPLIGALGIGARGLDTVEERKFLQASFTGDLSMNIETLRKLTDARLKKLLEAANLYNQRRTTLRDDGYSVFFGNYEQYVRQGKMPELVIPQREKVKEKETNTRLDSILNNPAYQ
jgi:hypothetical protein